MPQTKQPRIIKIHSEHAIFSKQEIINFIYEELGNYRDSISDIRKSINYATSNFGFLLLAITSDILGALVINNFENEYTLTYIAVNRAYRNQGIGSRLLARALVECDGDIGLHVRDDNPACDFYKKMGFEVYSHKFFYVYMKSNKYPNVNRT